MGGIIKVLIKNINIFLALLKKYHNFSVQRSNAMRKHFAQIENKNHNQLPNKLSLLETPLWPSTANQFSTLTFFKRDLIITLISNLILTNV